MKPVLLRERSNLPRTLAVDRSANMVRGCKILGLHSLNNRRYQADAVKRAMPLYEGKSVYVDSPVEGKRRRFEDKLGRFTNVRFIAGQGLYGDFRYNPKHPLAEVLLGWVEHDPSAVGFAHSARCAVRHDNGVEVVEEIAEVESVDLVDCPATTKGLFESKGGGNLTVDQLLNALHPGAVPQTPSRPQRPVAALTIDTLVQALTPKASTPTALRGLTVTQMVAALHKS